MKLPSCEACQWTYPPELLSPYYSGDGNLDRCCGICALELSNQIHGAGRECFASPMAERLRQYAVTWRERHPEHCPKEGQTA